MRILKHRPLNRIDWLARKNLRAVVLGALGFSNRCIEAQTGLTKGQINYRLRRTSTRRMDYRDGTNGTAALVLRNVDSAVTSKIKQKLLNEQEKGVA